MEHTDKRIMTDNFKNLFNSARTYREALKVLDYLQSKFDKDVVTLAWKNSMWCIANIR